MHGASDLQNGTVVAQNMGFGVAAEKKILSSQTVS